MLVTTAKQIGDTSKQPFVTRRWLDADSDTMVQEVSHGGVAFRRQFRRVASSGRVAASP